MDGASINSVLIYSPTLFIDIFNTFINTLVILFIIYNTITRY